MMFLRLVLMPALMPMLMSVHVRAQNPACARSRRPQVRSALHVPMNGGGCEAHTTAVG